MFNSNIEGLTEGFEHVETLDYFIKQLVMFPIFYCVGSVKSPLKLSEEEWDHVFKTNLTGCWLVSKYVCKRMCDIQLKGSIINISSVSGLNRGQLPGAAAYASSKAGVNMLTKVILLDMIFLKPNHIF